MSTGKASDANFLDPFVFETYGPLYAEAFIESQFSYALNGQEELYKSDPSGTQDVRKSEMELQIEGACASKTSTLHSLESFVGQTQVKLDGTNPILWRSELLCPDCRQILEEDEMTRSQTTKCETKEEEDPRTAVVTEFQLSKISHDVGTCWHELGPTLRIANSKLCNLDEECKTNWEKAYKLLMMWKEEKGSSARAGRLADHLKDIGRTSIAEKLLGVSDGQLHTCSSSECDPTICLTVKCSLKNEVMLCEDDTGNTYLVRPVKRDKGNWDPNEIHKNKAVLETVAAAVQEMEKSPEQRREESLKRINSEVQELQQQLKRVKLDMVFTDERMAPSVDEKNAPKDKEPKNDLLGHDAKVPQLDEVHLLQACEEQQSLCQGIFNALIKLIGEVGKLKDDNFMCISKLWNFTKELKDQEKLFCGKIESLNSLKDNLSEDQTAELEKLAKWYKIHQKQVDGLERLLSSLLSQGRSTKNQKLLKHRPRSEPPSSEKPSLGLSRVRTKTDPSKHFSKSQSELQNSSRPSISDPFCPLQMNIMDTDRKPEEVQVCKNNRRITPWILGLIGAYLK
ncbi:PREDICTED: uncharacterized protein LOC107328253 [Acropora digitifera]|uniref:uncharacterized protein LOC107328253 n=1 Tax=Acropora digitifera TaxID=70779 RepID=UPI00077A2CD7|nr:PREDICTED: uncharacterized protein LOC107328253 [Acropora digitifera]